MWQSPNAYAPMPSGAQCPSLLVARCPLPVALEEASVPELSADQAIVFAILIVAFGLLITERLRNDIVAILIVVALSATGVLEPKEAVSGFSSEPAIVVAAIFVLSGGLHQT